MPLLPWLSQFMWPYASQATTADVAAAARLAAVEAVRTGTTFVLDNHYAPTDLDSVLAVVDATADVGLRGVVARGVNGPMNDVARSQGLLETMYPFFRLRRARHHAGLHARAPDRQSRDGVAGAAHHDVRRPGP